MKNGLYILSKGESPKSFGVTKEQAIEKWKKDFLSIPFNKDESEINVFENHIEVRYPDKALKMKTEIFEINFVEGEIPAAKKDKITFRMDEQVCNCSGNCDCEPDITIVIRINGKTGWGYAQWVVDEKNNDLLSINFLGSHREVKNYEEMFDHIELMVKAFKNVEVERHLSKI